MSDHDDREPHALEFDTSGAPLSRRTLFRRTAGAALAVAGSALAGRAAAQEGYKTPGGRIPFRRPLCLETELDRKEYFNNLEVHSVLMTDRGCGGVDDNAMCPLWVRGARRLLKSGIDITDPKKPFVAQDRFPGGWLFYATHLKKWICWQNVAVGGTSPSPEYPWGGRAGPDAEERTSKYFQEEYAARTPKDFRGLRPYDVTVPDKPVQLNEWRSGQTGIGGHAHMWDGGRYMYLMNSWDESFRLSAQSFAYGYGLRIIDVLDPANIKDVAKWWVPGQKYGEEAEYAKWPWAGNGAAWDANHGAAFVPRRVEDGGRYGYCGMGAFGMFVLDLSNITKPTPVGHVSHPMELGQGSIPYHTCMPIETGQGLPTLVIAVDEECVSDGRGQWHPTYMIDVKDPANPKIIGFFPRPAAPKDASYTDFACARGRFGTHNSMSWSPPGAPRTDITALTHFIAGVRLYDIRDPREPKEVAWFVPKRFGTFTDAEWTSWRREEPSAFIEWDRNLIWISDREKLMCCSTPMLGKPILEPRKVERWAVPHVNRGWDDQTPKSVYFGRPLSQVT